MGYRPAEAWMTELLQRFCRGAEHDPALRAFSTGCRAMFHCLLVDLGLEFHLGLRDGSVIAGLGTSPVPAELRIETDSRTLDALLGTFAPGQAAGKGRLSLEGDLRMVGLLSALHGEVSRLYRDARRGAGELVPGAALDPRVEMVRVIEELYRLGLITARGGNVSLRMEGQEWCWITPCGLYKGAFRPEQMVRIDLEGNPLDPGESHPSSEWALHTEIYRARPEVRAVVHAHAPYATVLALSGLAFAPVTTEAALLGEVPTVPFVMPGTRDLAHAVVKALGHGTACILANHGVVAVAPSLRAAADAVQTLERTAQLIVTCHALGKAPEPLPEETVRMLREKKLL